MSVLSFRLPAGRALVSIGAVCLFAAGCSNRLGTTGSSGDTDTESNGDTGIDVTAGIDDGGDDLGGGDWGGGCEYAFLDICTPPTMPTCGDGQTNSDEACDDGLAFGTFDGCTNSCRLGPQIVTFHQVDYASDQRIVPTGLFADPSGTSMLDGVQISGPSGVEGVSWSTSVDGTPATAIADMALRDVLDDGALYFTLETAQAGPNDPPGGSPSQTRVQYRIDDANGSIQGAFDMPAPFFVPEGCVDRIGRSDLRIGRFTVLDANDKPTQPLGVVSFDLVDVADASADWELLADATQVPLTPAVACARLGQGPFAYAWLDPAPAYVARVLDPANQDAQYLGPTIASADYVGLGVAPWSATEFAWLGTNADKPSLTRIDTATGFGVSEILTAKTPAHEGLDALGSGLVAVRSRDTSTNEVVWEAYRDDGLAFTKRMPLEPQSYTHGTAQAALDRLAWLADTRLTVTNLNGGDVYTIDLPPEMNLNRLLSIGDGRVLVLGASENALAMAIVDGVEYTHDFEVHEFDPTSSVQLINAVVVDANHVGLQAIISHEDGSRSYWAGLVEMSPA